MAGLRKKVNRFREYVNVDDPSSRLLGGLRAQLRQNSTDRAKRFSVCLGGRKIHRRDGVVGCLIRRYIRVTLPPMAAIASNSVLHIVAYARIRSRRTSGVTKF